MRGLSLRRRRWSWRPSARKLWAGLFCCAAVAAIAGGLAQTRIDTGIASFLPSGDPAYRAIEDKARAFGGDPIVVLLESRTPDTLMLQEDQLMPLVGLEGRLARLPDVAAVDGPATALNQTAAAAQNTLAQISGRRDAVRNAAITQARSKGLSDKQAQDAGEAAQAQFDQRYGGLLVSAMPAGLPTLHNQRFVATVLYADNGQPRPQWRSLLPNDRTVAILVRPRENLDQAATGRLTDAVRSAVGHSGLDLAKTTVTGVPVITSALTARAQRELPLLGAVAVVAVGLVFLLVPWSRRRRSRCRPVLAATIGTAATLAVFGWVHHPLSLGVVAFLPMLLGIGSDFPLYLSQPAGGRRALVAALAAAAGFAALSLSALPFVRELGLAMAIGIATTVAVSLGLRRVLGPVETVAAQAPAPARAHLRRTHRLVLLGIAILVAAAGWSALPRLGIEASPDQLAQGLPELGQAQYAENVLGSAGEVSIMIRGHDVLTPEVLRWAQDAETAIVRAHGDQLRPMVTMADLLQFLGPNPSSDEVRSAGELLPPYLSSAVLTPDHSAATLVFGVQLQDLQRQRDLFAAVTAALPPPPPGTEVQLVGLPVAAVHGLDLVSSSRIPLNVAGLLAAGLVLMLGLRRRSDAGRAVLTVLLATGWVLGLAWLVTGTLSPLTVAVGSLTTATGCEFAVMLAGAHRNRRASRNVATAAAAGTAGYLVLVCSDLAVLRQFGLLLAAGVALSYLSALIVVRLIPPGPVHPSTAPGRAEPAALVGATVNTKEGAL